jgi:hypothetical protein
MTEQQNAALAAIKAGAEIRPGAIAAAIGCNRKEAAALIIELQESGAISAPDEDGIRKINAE